jgi:nicotinate-nucleotide adenylyltransferase
MKIGIFGGTFNPVHNGHIKIAHIFKDKYHLDKVLFIPNYISPFKTDSDDMASAKHRLKMLELALLNEPDFEIDDFEIKRNTVSYTIDTINFLSQKYLEEELLLLIGSDQAASFDKWKDYEKILQKVVVVIAGRNAASKEEKQQIAPVLKKNASFLDNEFLDISSLQIRTSIRKGVPVFEQLPFVVDEYIINNLLYI